MRNKVIITETQLNRLIRKAINEVMYKGQSLHGNNKKDWETVGHYRNERDDYDNDPGNGVPYDEAGEQAIWDAVFNNCVGEYRNGKIDRHELLNRLSDFVEKAKKNCGVSYGGYFVPNANNMTEKEIRDFYKNRYSQYNDWVNSGQELKDRYMPHNIYMKYKKLKDGGFKDRYEFFNGI